MDNNLMVYTEKELGVLSNICEMLLSSKNKTELKQFKKSLVSYMKLLSNLHNHLKLDYKEFEIVRVGKHTLCSEFPASVIYDVEILEK